MMKKLSLLVSILFLLFGLGVEISRADSRQFTVGQLRYEGGNWNSRPNGIRSLFSYMELRTSIEASSKVEPLNPDSKDIFSFPFIVWSGNQEFPPLSSDAVLNLRKYLRFGGFIFIDDHQGAPGFGFDLSISRELKRIFPNETLNDLPPDHTVFRSFYLLKQAYGRVQSRKTLKGITLQGRTVIIYSSNDLLGAVSRDPFGNWQYDVSPGGETQRKKSFRLGVNVVMYALCDDYKKDTLHVDYILKRRQLR